VQSVRRDRVLYGNVKFRRFKHENSGIKSNVA